MHTVTLLAVLTAALAVSAPPAKADFRLCNNTGSRVGVAIGYKDNEGWTTEGWWNVSSRSCETLLRGALVARYYYIYAVDYDRGGEWSGKAYMGRHIQYADLSLPEFRKRAQLHIEALNNAVANIPPEQLRMHLCWGNYEGPHHRDVPLADVIDLVFTAKPVAISLEAANPRHAHEWTLFERVKLPDGKVLIPGVIESKSNFIEHPELIAQRITRYANLVGRENVIAGSDCGFGTWVGQAAVDPDVVFAKLKAMADGAALASRQFWK